MRGGRFVLRIDQDSTVDTSDTEGRPTAATVTQTQVRGNLSILTASEARRAEHYGEHIAAAAHVPSGTVIDHTARIILDPTANPGVTVPAELTGTWQVAAVRHARPFLRVLLRRENHP